MPEGRFSQNYALSKERYYSVALFIASMKKKYSKKELPVIGAHCLGYHSRNFSELGLYPVWTGCQAGIGAFGIKSNGDIIGCLAIQNDSYIEGNVRERSLVDIWNDPDAFSYTRDFKVENLGENCSDCKYGATCKGGCMGMSFAFTEKPHNHPYCFYKIEDEILLDEKIE
jgi:radical SAM protein with 4Fe4S-binding SPASM domain